MRAGRQTSTQGGFHKLRLMGTAAMASLPVPSSQPAAPRLPAPVPLARSPFLGGARRGHLCLDPLPDRFCSPSPQASLTCHLLRHSTWPPMPPITPVSCHPHLVSPPSLARAVSPQGLPVLSPSIVSPVPARTGPPRATPRSLLGDLLPTPAMASGRGGRCNKRVLKGHDFPKSNVDFVLDPRRSVAWSHSRPETIVVPCEGRGALRPAPHAQRSP